MSSDEANDYDHFYYIRSPCRLRRKVDDLKDQVESLKKKLNISEKKKVSSLMTVESELK